MAQGRRYSDAELQEYLRMCETGGHEAVIHTLKECRGNSAALPKREVVIDGDSTMVNPSGLSMLDSARLGQLAQDY